MKMFQGLATNTLIQAILPNPKLVYVLCFFMIIETCYDGTMDGIIMMLEMGSSRLQRVLEGSDRRML